MGGGVKAGIGVGIALDILECILVAAVLIFLRKRCRPHGLGPAYEAYRVMPAEMGGHGEELGEFVIRGNAPQLDGREKRNVVAREPVELPVG
jgi:hypothetical protein